MRFVVINENLQTLKEVQPHMTGGNAYFWMYCGECPQAIDMRAQDKFHEPIWSIIFQSNGTSVCNMKVPSYFRSNCNPTVTLRMPM
jgi:hypothetical protein